MRSWIFLMFQLNTSVWWAPHAHVDWIHAASWLTSGFALNTAPSTRRCGGGHLSWVFGEVGWRFELTAPPSLLLRKDRDQIKIWVSTAFHAGFLKVMRYNWLPDRADVCGGQGTGRKRERRVWQIYGTAMGIFVVLVGYLNRIEQYKEVGWRICCAVVNRWVLHKYLRNVGIKWGKDGTLLMPLGEMGES